MHPSNTPSITRHRLLASGALALALASCGTAKAAIVTLNPNRDTSIYSENDNSNALGGLYVGTTPASSIRRALVGFDIISSIPAGATINSVSLTLVQTKIGPAASATFELHPIQKSWGEGSSSGIGTGGAPTAGDATWNAHIYNANPWTTPGGDIGSTSGTTVMSTALTSYAFASQAGMVADVQGWLDAPTTNFGWLIRAADEGTTSARELGSRESPLNQQPTLTINYTAVPEPGVWGLLGASAIAACASRRRRLGSA